MDAGATVPSRGRILVADDEPHIRRILATLLGGAGFAVSEVSDGDEALAALEAPSAPDLLILDLMMPRVSGLEVLDRLQARPTHRRMPVIVLTAKGQDADRHAALLAGADEFMTKPFSPKKLLARIQEILSAR